MSDGASDTSDIITPPESRDPIGRQHPLMPSPTLVPSAQSRSGEDIISQLQRAAAGTKAESKADIAPEPSIELQDAPDQPLVPDTDIEPIDPSPDTLKLLQELARKNSNDRGLHTPAAQLDSTLASYRAVIGMIDELNSAHRNGEPQPPARGGTNWQIAQFAIAGCSAILAGGMFGLFLWSQINPAHDSEPRMETDVTVTAPAERSAVPAVQARPDIPSVQTAMAECDLAVSRDPYAAYFLVTQNALSSNVPQAAELSGEDYGWYSLMSLKARLERRGGAC